MQEIRTHVEIAASPERVWNVLMDFAAFPAWNPFIRSISGEARSGGKLEVHIQPPGRGVSVFRPTVQVTEPNRELRWLGHLLVSGLFDGEHQWRLEPLDAGHTRFLHSERFKGILVPLFGKELLTDSARGFEEMNCALKERVERDA